MVSIENIKIHFDLANYVLSFARTVSALLLGSVRAYGFAFDPGIVSDLTRPEYFLWRHIFDGGRHRVISLCDGW